MSVVFAERRLWYDRSFSESELLMYESQAPGFLNALLRDLKFYRKWPIKNPHYSYLIAPFALFGAFLGFNIVNINNIRSFGDLLIRGLQCLTSVGLLGSAGYCLIKTFDTTELERAIAQVEGIIANK